MATKTLVEEITNILTELGHPNPNLWKEDNNIKVAISSNSGTYERLYVNRYWREYLGLLPTDTMTARFCLDDNEPTSTYLKYFRQVVAPIIIQYQK
jgi:hypothetical protein